MTPGLCVRIYAKCCYDNTMIVEDNRRSLLIIENVFSTIINDYKPLLMVNKQQINIR